MRRGDAQEAQLIGRTFDTGVLQHRPVGQKFEIVLHFTAIQPHEGVEPLENDRQFRQKDIDGMAFLYMDLLVHKDLPECFRVIQRRVDKDGAAEGAGTPVARGVYDAAAAVPDYGAGEGLVAKQEDLEDKLHPEDQETEDIDEGKPSQ